MSTCYPHVSASIADQAEVRAKQLQDWAGRQREFAAGWAAHAQRHYTAEAEQLEAKAAVWRERARLAREGTIEPDASDPEWAAICVPLSYRWPKPE